ncbi:unnamed protein product [Phytophthora lilii]|uniref:Unnamed protein product n=1 Tax=Phytophthora lilii TaxID=2077276 RepID=A0A9W6TRE0_9STRA|nr:unnamed protein product [Phytophthora lilii]
MATFAETEFVLQLTQGCEFNVLSLSCEAKSTEATTNGTTYCSSNNTACAACTATSTDRVCKGEDGLCTCQSLCSVIEPTATSECTSADESFIIYVGIAVGIIFVMAGVYLIIKCRQRYLLITRRRAFVSQQLRENELLRVRQPQLALNLAGWRDTVELNKPELHKLGACCYVANQTQRDGNSGSAHLTGEAAVITIYEGEEGTSMETSSTFSEMQSPISSVGESSFTSSPTEHASCDDGDREDTCDYNALSDSNTAHGDPVKDTSR